jgi:serine/threonine protein phosphatase PrpC
VRSDVGLLREGNEDSAYAGPHLLAVADGMGGHAAGEVASAETITTIAPLDAEHDGNELVAALEDAVARANLRLQELIISDPAIEGMGTTLTALLWSDGYAALCHIGDSRAYLLRGGQLSQITHDHTLVQSLVDEGKISEDDVATHPHRSLLLRALDGRTIAEPDLKMLETYPGDRYLLCSDGLSGVVTELTLAQTLTSVRDPDKAALQLVELAIRGGGPDNITCIVADVMETAASPVAPTWTPVFAGAAALGGGAADLRAPSRQSSPATRARHLARTTPQPALPTEPATGVWKAASASYRDGYTGSFETASFSGGRADGFRDGGFPDRDYPGGGQDGGFPASDSRRDTASFEKVDFDLPADEPDPRDTRGGGRHGRHHRSPDGDDYGQGRGRRRFPIVWTALILLVVLLAGGGYAGWLYNQSQYYVGVSNGKVAIFRGSNQNLAGISMSTLVSTSTLHANQLGATAQATLGQTIAQSGYSNARTLIGQLQGQADTCATQWKRVATWVTANAKYQDDLAAARLVKGKNSKNAIKLAESENPGKEPDAPDAANCGAASAFGISVTQPPVRPTPPVRATTTRPATSASATAGAKSTATAQPAATPRATTP